MQLKSKHTRTHTNNNKNISTPLIRIVYETIWLLANKGMSVNLSELYDAAALHTLENSIIKWPVSYCTRCVSPLCVSAINMSTEIGEHKYIYWLRYSPKTVLFLSTSSLFTTFLKYISQGCIQVVFSSFHCALCCL